MSQRTLLIKSAIITLIVAGVVGATAIGFRPSYVGTRQGKADENYIPSLIAAGPCIRSKIVASLSFSRLELHVAMPVGFLLGG